jgi:hypothetical protein
VSGEADRGEGEDGAFWQGRNRPGNLQTCGSPSTNFVVLSSCRAEGRKGEKRGESGLFIGTGYRRNGRGLKGLKRGGRSYCEWKRSLRDFGLELEDDWQVGPSCRRGNEGERIPFRVWLRVGRGPILMLGQMGSPRPFSIFIFLFSFLLFCFLISSILFANSFKSNQTSFRNFQKDCT